MLPPHGFRYPSPIRFRIAAFVVRLHWPEG